MLILVSLIILYSLIYLIVFVLAHQDANMLKPLTGMTVGMLIFLVITAIVSFSLSYWYIGIIVLAAIAGMFSFLLYLIKY